MAAPAALSAFTTRSLGVASSSGRHASFAPIQAAAGRAAGQTGGGDACGSPTLARQGHRMRYSTISQAAVSPRTYSASTSSLMNRPARTATQQMPRPAQPQMQQELEQAEQQQEQHEREPPNELELARRKKISDANKGRTPWNKGRRHSPETIARIKAGTLKAMQRPEVRQRLAVANEKREPHSSEVKEKIRVKLLKHAVAAREVINKQAAEIVSKRLLSSPDPVLRECGEYEQATEVVAGLAWQYFKKDWETVATVGWDEHPAFRERIVGKLTKLTSKKKAVHQPKKKRVNKVSMALAHMRKMDEAHRKLQMAESVMANLQRVKSAFAGDAARLQQALAAEKQAGVMISHLRGQLAALQEALQVSRLDLELEEGDYQHLRAVSQHRLELQQQLEAGQAQQGGTPDAAAAAAADLPAAESSPSHWGAGAAPASIADGSASSANDATDGWAASERDAAVNGQAASEPPVDGSESAAVAAQRPMPWQS
ncbi:hypothetical protein ACK3TF_001483 [Chlorella vulgaris]